MKEAFEKAYIQLVIFNDYDIVCTSGKTEVEPIGPGDLPEQPIP